MTGQRGGHLQAQPYKHFKSKDDLACEAMVRLLMAPGVPDQLPASHDGRQVLHDMLEWALRVRLGGGLPSCLHQPAGERDAHPPPGLWPGP